MNKIKCFWVYCAMLVGFMPIYAQSAERVTIVAELKKQPGNIGFTPDNRLIFSYHPFAKSDIRVAELMKDGTVKPFPNASWNDPASPDSMRFDNVLGVRGYSDGLVWVLDMGGRSNSVPKIVAWDTRKNALARIIYLPPPISHAKSFLDDFAVDRKHNVIYMTDASIGDDEGAALIVIDLKTGNARRVLAGDKSLIADRNEPIRAGGPTGAIAQFKDKNGKMVDLFVGADGIVTDKNDEWLYFCALSSRTMYRIKTSYLRDETLDDQALSTKIERYSDKTVNGGITIDNENNIYSTDLENGGIGVIGKDRKHRPYLSAINLTMPDGHLSDDKLTNADGVSFSPDGYIYSTMTYMRPDNQAKFYIVKYKSIASSVLGK